MLPEKDSSICCVDCAPDVDLVTFDEDASAQLPNISSLVHVDEKSSKLKMLLYNDMKGIIESVENELHVCTKLCLDEYVGFLVEEEVKKVVKFSEDDKLDEVTFRSLQNPSLVNL